MVPKERNSPFFRYHSTENMYIVFLVNTTYIIGKSLTIVILNHESQQLNKPSVFMCSISPVKYNTSIIKNVGQYRLSKKNYSEGSRIAVLHRGSLSTPVLEHSSTKNIASTTLALECICLAIC